LQRQTNFFIAIASIPHCKQSKTAKNPKQTAESQRVKAVICELKAEV